MRHLIHAALAKHARVIEEREWNFAVPLDALLAVHVLSLRLSNMKVFVAAGLLNRVHDLLEAATKLAITFSELEEEEDTQRAKLQELQAADEEVPDVELALEMEEEEEVVPEARAEPDSDAPTAFASTSDAGATSATTDAEF